MNNTLRVASMMLVVVVLVTPAMAKDEPAPLSAAARAILARIPGPITVTVGIHDVPKHHGPRVDELNALLQGMQRVIGAKRFTIRRLDMSTPLARAKAESLGIQKTMLAQILEDEVVETPFWFGLVIDLGLEAPVVLGTLGTHDAHPNLRYAILGAIEHAWRIRKPTIAWVQSSEQTMGLTHLTGFFRDCALKTDVTLEQPIPATVDALFLVAPRNLRTRQVYALEQYVLGGGRAMVLLDPLSIHNIFRGTWKKPMDSGLRPWLSHVGIQVGTACVGDRLRPGVFVVDNGLQRFPFWPIVKMRAGGAGPTIDMLMRWPVGISIDRAKLGTAQRTATLLGSSSGVSFQQKDLEALNTEKPPHDKDETIPLGVSMRGTFQSMFAKPPEGADASKHRTSGKGEIVVVGDASWTDKVWAPGKGSDQVVQLLAQFNGSYMFRGWDLVRGTLDLFISSEALRAVLEEK